MPRRRDKPNRLAMRARVWLEVNGQPALTDAGADLLEQIQACGSLSEAARRLRFNYRRAWLLVDAMNSRWPTPLVITATGGRRGGGSQLTELGQLLLRHYRSTQIEMEATLDVAMAQLRHALPVTGRD